MSCDRDGQKRADGTGVEYLDGLYSYALILTRNYAEAEDLDPKTHTTFM